MKLRELIGQEVTLVERGGYWGFTGVLLGIGPKNFRVSAEGSGPSNLWDRSAYILLPGNRQDVIDRSKVDNTGYAQAKDRRRHERGKAIGEFELQWDAEHPWPEAPKLARLLAEIGIEEVRK